MVGRTCAEGASGTVGWAMREFDVNWLKERFVSGWAGIAWPKEYGGKGLTLLQQLIWYEEYAARGFPGIDRMFRRSVATPGRH